MDSVNMPFYNNWLKEQMPGPDLPVFTLKSLALKKTGFSLIKIPSKIFLNFLYLYSMQLFSADPKVFSK